MDLPYSLAAILLIPTGHVRQPIRASNQPGQERPLPHLAPPCTTVSAIINPTTPAIANRLTATQSQRYTLVPLHAPSSSLLLLSQNHFSSTPSDSRLSYRSRRSSYTCFIPHSLSRCALVSGLAHPGLELKLGLCGSTNFSEGERSPVRDRWLRVWTVRGVRHGSAAGLCGEMGDCRCRAGRRGAGEHASSERSSGVVTMGMGSGLEALLIPGVAPLGIVREVENGANEANDEK